MFYTPALLPRLISVINETIVANTEAVTALDQAIGDGDHVINLQRGLDALMAQREELSQLEDWGIAWQKIGMTIMSTVGGAAGSLLGTLFVSMSKAACNQQTFAAIFSAGVEAVKQRGKSDAGEKTMLDVLIPVAAYLQQAAADGISMPETLEQVAQVAMTGMESTRDMIATKGRASFLEERTRGHIDAGAKTSQLIICAIVAECATPQT